MSNFFSKCYQSQTPTFNKKILIKWIIVFFSGEVNGAFLNDAQSLTGSRKAHNMQPVMLMQPGPGEADRYSEFSNRTGRSKVSGYRGEYSSSVQNFQLWAPNSSDWLLCEWICYFVSEILNILLSCHFQEKKALEK